MNFFSASYNSNQDLLDHLKSRGFLESETVYQAMKLIPRGDFLPVELLDSAYQDSPLRCSRYGFNASAPHIYGKCLSELEIEQGNSVLDIGTGTGHFAALASYLCGSLGRVHGLDIKSEIVNFARSNTETFKSKSGLNINVEYFVRNCFLADPDDNVYDRIYVGAACPKDYVHQLLKALSPNGIMIVPAGEELLKYVKVDGKLKVQYLLGVRYSELELPHQHEIQISYIQHEREKSLKVLIPKNGIDQSFRLLINDQKFSDVQLYILGNKTPINVHSFIFYCRIPSFFKEFIEPQQINLSESPLVSILLPDFVTEKNLMMVLEYVYCAKLIDPTIFESNNSSPDQVNLELDNLHETLLYFKIDSLVEYFDNVSTILQNPQPFNLFQDCQSKHLQMLVQSFNKIPENIGTDYTFHFKGGDIDIISSETVPHLLEISDFYDDQFLKSHCESILAKSVEIDNVVCLYILSSRLNAKQLFRICKEFIIENYPKVSKTANFQDLDKELLCQLLQDSCSYFQLLFDRNDSKIKSVELNETHSQNL
ncbi:hypothetical protein DFA_10827 [Cavenderia fasciculata]|uniref:BTB domain-containing protein n=1 Tax=Cavenderia fasciculata TaxID=261658 RepID=F4QBI1_CACFS|nr:uncharacterized protein DFA_10827 [Cavenderia fasciculata]EGG14953.1 hypothetical protein DFA_10827 [Cavenderia fasciculata]|eukprot:XP_004351469.1 hypothetical protein DFA_10827 [Cavenderia fasciculata]